MNRIHLPDINTTNNKINKIISQYPSNIKDYGEYNNLKVKTKDKPKFYYRISDKGPTLLKSILQERGKIRTIFYLLDIHY